MSYISRCIDDWTHESLEAVDTQLEYAFTIRQFFQV